jgi:PAS domain S-box-containing protein
VELVDDLYLMGDTRVDTEAVLGALPEALCVVDPTERIALWSPEAERLLGHEAIDLIDEPVQRIFPGAKQDEHDDMLAVLAQGTVVRDRFTEAYARDGRAVPVLLTAFPLRDAQGHPGGYGLLFRQVAPMSEAQSRLALSARIESLGRLVAGVGHEINNPCGFVLANLQHVRRGLQQAGEAATEAGVPQDAIEALQDAEQGALRIRDLVASMRLFARGKDFERVPIEIRDVVEDAERLAVKDTPGRTALWIDRGPPCTVLGDRTWLGQVVLNLILNAADAFSTADPAQNRISVYWEVRDHNVEVHVVDNGPGIATADLEHIFDPFYTTKAPNRGVGLGLSICHDIVTRHDGHIRARSEPERGTDICVSLPLAVVAF